MKRIAILLGLLLGAAVPCARAELPVQEIIADPANITLRGAGARFQLLIHGKVDGGQVDLTRAASYRSSRPDTVRIGSDGVIHAVGDGLAEVTVEASGKTATVRVQIEGTKAARQFHFENDIEPLLGRFGCNASGCHGKASGQNGFKLSVFGFDPTADFAAITKEARGRRIFPAAPEHSLLLLKMSGGMAHGGGVRIPRGSAEYETFRSWIAAGTPFGDSDAPKVVSLRVEPRERVLAMKDSQQLRAMARFSDGREIDVTAHARFQSNNEALASVDAGGLVTAGEAPGDVAVMASYLNAVDVFRALIPRPKRIDPYPPQPANNFIDPLVFARLRKLNLLPSELASDAEFLRRVYLDVIGTLPTADEARRFLADRRPDRRARLVDELLTRPEFADFWALKWADLLRVDRQALGHKGAYAYYRWIRESLAVNKPLDRFARELLTAEGPLQELPAGHFYKVANKPGDAAGTWAQVFLGVRITCAECHHHPFDRWDQADYYGMRAFFTPLAVTKTPRGEMMTVGKAAPNPLPRTGQEVFAHPLGTPPPNAAAAGDRRSDLANWLTAPDNPYFARNLGNRVWAHFLGRGLVEPVDDVRATNPPSNPELLDALARHLIESKYDLRQLIRAIAASRVYQLSCRPNDTNDRDEQNYSRALFRRLDAEVLLDMVCQSTGVPEKFAGVPAGQRAIQLWDSKVPHYFLKLFGRPVRASACECERNHEPGVAQVLHLLNSPAIHAKLAHEDGTVARLVRRLDDDGKLAEELYLTYYGRLPEAKERQMAVEYLGKGRSRRREAAEDLAWSLMNSLEFVFNH